MAKLFHCAYCGKPLTNAQVFQHTQYTCPKRPSAAGKKGTHR